MRSRTVAGRGIVIAALAAAVSIVTLAAQQPRVPGAFRAEVVLVPVDVRVLDRSGNPVTDLQQEDFTVFEDGIPQTLGHFSTHTYAPGAVTRETPALRRVAGLSADPPTYRTFLIVLGRGRLDGPARGLQALASFVRDDLLPQDFLGVIAYNRTSALTTDHDRVLRFLERYQAMHHRLETSLRTNAGRNGTLNALFGRAVPGDVQRRIDGLFDDPLLPGARTLPPLALDGVMAVEAEWRRSMDERADLQGRRVFEDQSLGASDLRSPYRPDSRLDAAPVTISGQQDLEKLYVGIEYLRYLDGEKHLIFLSEDGLLIGRPEHHDSLAGVAADARVTLWPIRTGGLPTALAAWPDGERPRADWSVSQDSRAVARMTGGVASDFEMAAEGLKRLHHASRSHYLLGYYSANTNWNGGFRRVEVRVAPTRSDVTVLHRGGYYGHAELVPYDRQRFLSHAWMVSAAAYRKRISDIGVGVGAIPDGTGGLSVEVTVNPAHVTIAEAVGGYRASFELAVFVSGADGGSVGEVWRSVDVMLSPTDHKRLLSGQFLAWRTTLNTSAPARSVKAVVFDAERDRLGTAFNHVRQR